MEGDDDNAMRWELTKENPRLYEGRGWSWREKSGQKEELDIFPYGNVMYGHGTSGNDIGRV